MFFFADGDLEARSSHSKNLALAAKERMKELWQKAIFDTILLIRMDKENKLIEEGLSVCLSVCLSLSHQ